MLSMLIIGDNMRKSRHALLKKLIGIVVFLGLCFALYYSYLKISYVEVHEINYKGTKMIYVIDGESYTAEKIEDRDFIYVDKSNRYTYRYTLDPFDFRSYNAKKNIVRKE